MRTLIVIYLLLLSACGQGDSATPRNDQRDIVLKAPRDDASIELSVTVKQAEVNLQEGAVEPQVIAVDVTGDVGPDLPLSVELQATVPGELQELDYRVEIQSVSHGEVSARLHLRLRPAMAPLQPHSREFLLVVNNAETRSELPLLAHIEPVALPDVYLLIGQSNMEGYSEDGARNASPGGPDESNPRIRQLNVQANNVTLYADAGAYRDEEVNTALPSLIAAQDPLHQPLSAGQRKKGGSRVGVGLSFAKAALADTTQSIYLVPAAWSGSGFCAGDNGQTGWNASEPDHPALQGGLLADRALTRLNMTLRETGGIFRGILWHQGESDSNSADCAALYAGNLRKLIARIRSEAIRDLRGAGARGTGAAVPVVMGTMSKGDDVRGQYSLFNDFKRRVDGVHRNISTQLPFAGFSNNDDLVPPAYPCGDSSCVHFGAAANRERGARLYQALQRVIAAHR